MDSKGLGAGERMINVFVPGSDKLKIRVNDKSIHRMYIDFGYIGGSTFLSCASTTPGICVGSDCNLCGGVREFISYRPIDMDASVNQIKELREYEDGYLKYIFYTPDSEKDKKYSKGCLILYFEGCPFNFEFTTEHGFYTDKFLHACRNINMFKVGDWIKRPKIRFKIYRINHKRGIHPAF